MWIHLSFDPNQHVFPAISPELAYNSYQEGVSNARKT